LYKKWKFRLRLPEKDSINHGNLARDGLGTICNKVQPVTFEGKCENMTRSNDEISVENATAASKDDSTVGLLNGIGMGELTEEKAESVLNEAISVITEHLGAERGYVMLNDDNAQLANIASIYRDGQSEALMTASSAVTDKVMETAGGIIVAGAMQSEQFPGDPNFQRFNIHCAICAAIKTTDSTLGVIYADSNSDCKWDNRHLELLEFIGLHMGLAVSNINLGKKVRESKRLAATGTAALTLSHSVKNILQMIGGAAEIVDFGLRTNQIHRVKRSWDILKPNLERMRKYTLEMLDYSKERPLKLGACDFNRVIQGAIESLKSQLKQKNSKLNIRIDQKMPTVEMDGERIHEMALNLILNAIDIVDESGGIVSVETRYMAEQEEVLLGITDNGPGMTEDMKEKIFTPFESKKSKFGTGLGMPIAKQVIEQHNGRIEIETEVGKGTTFNVLLPAKIVSPESSVQPPSDHPTV